MLPKSVRFKYSLRIHVLSLLISNRLAVRISLNLTGMERRDLGREILTSCWLMVDAPEGMPFPMPSWEPAARQVAIKSTASCSKKRLSSAARMAWTSSQGIASIPTGRESLCSLSGMRAINSSFRSRTTSPFISGSRSASGIGKNHGSPHQNKATPSTSPPTVMRSFRATGSRSRGDALFAAFFVGDGETFTDRQSIYLRFVHQLRLGWGNSRLAGANDACQI